MLLFQKIEDLAHAHTDARRVIGEFLLSEKSRIQNYSMQEIADKTFTSKSSLVRFAKALDFGGWKEFMEAFLGEIHYQESHYTDSDPNFPFKKDATEQDILIQLSNLSVEAILDTADQLDLEELKKAVEILYNSNQIALLGQSPNTYVGNLFRRKMISIGRNVLMYETDQGLLAQSLNEGDCVIMISYSGNGEKRVPLRFMPFLKEKNIPVIAITGLGDNLLRQQADCVLSMSSRERLYTKISTFATEESAGFILNMLFSCYFARNYDCHLQKKIDFSKKLETSRYSIYSDIKEQEDIL